MAKSKSGLGRGLDSLLGQSVEEAMSGRSAETTPTYSSSDFDSQKVENTQEIPRIVVEDIVQKPADTPSSGIESSTDYDVKDDNGTLLTNAASPSADKQNSQDISTLPIDKIVPNPDQPRTRFKPEEIDELAESIKREGLIQPIVVRLVEDQYQIVAGERRWQACRAAEIKVVPVRVVDVSDEKAIELALIENIQRSDLNPIEEARGYQQLIDGRGMTQSQVAEVVSKGRSTIANALRLLELPNEAQQLLYDEVITAGHARAILSIPTPEGRQILTERLSKERLSVRDAENIARSLTKGKEEKATTRSAEPQPASYKKVAQALQDVMQTDVRIKTVQGKSRIEIDFKDEDDLKRLFNKFIGN